MDGLERRHHRQADGRVGLATQEYWYSYHYAYRPEVMIANGKMLVAGMAKAIRVRRLV